MVLMQFDRGLAKSKGDRVLYTLPLMKLTSALAKRPGESKVWRNFARFHTLVANSVKRFRNRQSLKTPGSCCNELEYLLKADAVLEKFSQQCNKLKDATE